MNSHRQTGFTLIELIIFIVVVAAGLAGILSVMNTVVKSSADPVVRKQSIAIAEALLEEILLKDYANPVGGYTGAVRTQFDDVSDYAGYSTSGGIVDIAGTSVPGLTGYNVSPAVTVAATTDLTGVAAKKITVSVTGQGETITLVGYRTSY
jgi:MSHA pilin protein MshD